MNLQPPQEEKETYLPGSCYFNDGKSKVDYVIVYPKLEQRVRGDHSEVQINQFIDHIKQKGLLIEKDFGKFHKTLVFLKIHGPHKLLTRYASIYNVGLTCQNPYYKYKETIWFRCLTTELTRPDPLSDIYQRAERTLSGKRPTEITTGERSKIVYEILKRISFTFDDDICTLKTMLDQEIFLQAYAIHDSDCEWTADGLLSDRQLLFRFWASFRYIFREQPIHLIEKYYGPKIAFYFALVSLYTKMLIVPTIVGILTVLTGALRLHSENHYIEEDACSSDLLLCSDQKLKSACNMMKIAYIIDNPVTIVYVILCSFWGVIFWNLWQRRQAMLRLRWNLMAIKADRTMRKEFQENAKSRKSSITGEIEYYVPTAKKILSTSFSYCIVLVMIVIFCLIVFLIVEYRFMLRDSLNYDETNNANELELFTSSILTAVVIMIIDTAKPLIMKLYSKIIRFLTLLRTPRTQIQYNRMYLHMMFIITFTNHFSTLFYLAYIRGFFHRYPGETSNVAIIGKIQLDLCNASGCLIDLGVQLAILMVFKTMSKWSFDLIQFLLAPWNRYMIPKDQRPQHTQWEKDFAMKELDDSSINQLYTDLVLQYSFITFFNASFPIIGLVALVHNLLKIQHDAFRFLKLYRKPIREQVSDIEGWNQVIKVVTVMGCISNTFIVAFRTNCIQRILYSMEHNGTLKGFINSTLSKFAISDFQDDTMIIDHRNEIYCYYGGYRYPPEHEKKYEATADFWKHLAIRTIYFIILEKVTLLLSLALGYLMPEIPRKVKVKLEHDEKLLKAYREEQMEVHKESS